MISSNSFDDHKTYLSTIDPQWAYELAIARHYYIRYTPRNSTVGCLFRDGGIVVDIKRDEYRINFDGEIL